LDEIAPFWIGFVFLGRLTRYAGHRVGRKFTKPLTVSPEVGVPNVSEYPV
jgi:hypothetical protein